MRSAGGGRMDKIKKKTLERLRYKFYSNYLVLPTEETKVKVSLVVSNRRKTRRPPRYLCTVPHYTLSRASDKGHTPQEILLSFPPTFVKLRREPPLAILPKGPRKHSETPRHFCQLLTLPRTH
jgi:hypothetical protein